MKKNNPKDHVYSVYALECPIENKIKYVGQTENLRKRFLGHVGSPTKYTKAWISELAEKGLLPKMIEIERATLYQIDEKEKYWILHYEKVVGGLLNRDKYIPVKLKKELPIIYLPEQILTK